MGRAGAASKVLMSRSVYLGRFLGPRGRPIEAADARRGTEPATGTRTRHSDRWLVPVRDHAAEEQRVSH